MAAYLISEVAAIDDPGGFEEYRRLVAATVEPFGGKYLVRARAFELLEGDWQAEALVVIEFESAAKAKEWWSSDAYSEVKKIRQRTAKSKLIIVGGV
jgi:uncharacterized protein (DUF1330 family)